MYFVCPGDATVTSTTVQCSSSISTVKGNDEPLLSLEDLKLSIDGLFYIVGLILLFWLIKRAIDI